ncbi:MAG: VPLPA-CTERM sorting domain-containing protein [Pseudomonadales bacterium]|nr:VPLPA-CTERM sorting domain-containing protein [Pseudomonadales bacterium]
MRVYQLLLAGLVGVAGAFSASAATVTGQFSGTLGAPVGAGSGIVFSGAGSNQLLWGTSGGSNSLTINPNTINETIANNWAGSFLLGTLTWNNQSTTNGGGTWTSTANIAVDYSAPTDLPPVTDGFNLIVHQTTDPTSLTGWNEFTGLNPDDISGLVVSGASFGGTPLNLGANLSIIGYYAALVNAGTAGWSTNGLSSTYDTTSGLWVNREGNTSVLGIYANVLSGNDPAVVPLPAAAWLFGSALFGLVAVARRKAALA